MNPKTTNFEKFQTSNPVVRRLIDRFFGKIRATILKGPVERLLDAGCGEGNTLYQIRDLLPESVTAFDINPTCVEYTGTVFPQVAVTVEDIYKLPYAANAFDLVLCMEVLEHLPDPLGALRSLKRVGARRLIFSVPHEPWFRLGSLFRGKYLKTFGNHPEHINHWSPKSFELFLRKEFEQVSVDSSFPWIIAEVTLIPQSDG